ncbi:NAD-dependent protein deacetylase [Algiphilus sp.]|uniref:NAD-dependent protein deacetylase n=1 Tax=Algiphilus sp. TaxID=1872431 RepID=UPI0025B856E2|nr:NAD-dependent protein deacetylase [Algiphilus sp.]MCK5771505.1 NAD-dependent protein deacetylase [Algiphilus sp.]
MDTPAVAEVTDCSARLAAWLRPHRRLFVLTGAGISTGAGIPDYRDGDGGWKRARPITFQQFRSDAGARRRYWARSHAGWPVVSRAKPTAAHRALAAAEAAGRVHALVTQNVDGLHGAAGHRRVIDLHGRIDRLICLECAGTWPRAELQDWLDRRFPRPDARSAPDGDADLESIPPGFRIPDCPHCGGMIKPDVVFFGENVPRPRVDAAMAALAETDALLVVGSSLMVWSGYRFVRAARELGMPCCAVNLGRTRADPLLDLRIAADCDAALAGFAGGGSTAADSVTRGR